MEVYIYLPTDKAQNVTLEMLNMQYNILSCCIKIKRVMGIRYQTV